MIKSLYLFRHGDRQGDNEASELTQLGIAQATELSQYLKNTKIDVFYSSPYKRAIHTAQIVAIQHPNANIISDDRLAECAYWWEDVDNQEIRDGKLIEKEIVDGKVIKEWVITDELLARRNANFARVKSFFDELIANSEYENVAVASHGGVTRALLMASGHKIGIIKHCEYFHLKLHDNTWEILDNKRW